MKKEAFQQDLFLATMFEGISSARIELEKLKNLLIRASKMIENSEERDQLYREAGDIIVSVPKRIEYLEIFIEKTLYGLSLAAKESLKTNLPLEERQTVEEVMQTNVGFHRTRKRNK